MKHSAPDFAGLYARLSEAVSRRSVSATDMISLWQRLFADISEGQCPIPGSLLTKLSRASGISEANLAEGIRLQCSGWARCERDPARWPVPSRIVRVAIVAAGNIPGVAVAPAVLLAAAGLPVVVKLARTEQWVLPWLLDCFHRRHPDLPTGIYADYWPADSEAIYQLLQTAERIIAFGHTQTIRQLQEHHPGKVLGFGHKFTIAYVAPAAFTPQAAKELAKDIVLYNQSGCLSVQAVFVQGDAGTAERVAAVLGNELDRLVNHLGGLALPPAAIMKRHALRDTLDLLGLKCWHGAKLEWLVTLVPEFSLERLLGGNVVQVIPVHSAEEAFQALNPFRKAVQGCALCVEAGRFAQLSSKWRAFGCSYVSLPGTMQCPPLDWPNENRYLPEIFLE